MWITGALVDVSLKVDLESLKLLEDLILGTQFIINIDDALRQYKIK